LLLLLLLLLLFIVVDVRLNNHTAFMMPRKPMRISAPEFNGAGPFLLMKHFDKTQMHWGGRETGKRKPTGK
jgi:hypothetical protein